MAKLHSKADGCYVIVGQAHDEIYTLQLWGKGVLYLKDNNIHEGDQVPDWILSELWRKGWVYVGNS